MTTLNLIAVDQNGRNEKLLMQLMIQYYFNHYNLLQIDFSAKDSRTGTNTGQLEMKK